MHGKGNKQGEIRLAWLTYDCNMFGIKGVSCLSPNIDVLFLTPNHKVPPDRAAISRKNSRIKSQFNGVTCTREPGAVSWDGLPICRHCEGRGTGHRSPTLQNPHAR